MEKIGPGANMWNRLSTIAENFYVRHARKVDMAGVALLFIVLLVVRLNSLNLKEQMHSDEIFSLLLCTCNKYYGQPLPEGTYSGAELKSLLADDGNIQEAVADIGRLWHNNGDAPHASLYYMALRIALIGFDTWDFDDYKWRGGLLNIVFFTLSFIVMYKLLRKIFGNRMALVLVGLAVAFGNILSVRNTLLIREYQMAETGILMLTYVGVCMIAAKRERRRVDGRLYFVWLTLSMAFTVSVGYFNAIYVLLFCMVLSAASIKYGESRHVFLIISSGLVAIAVAWLIYPGFFNFVLHETVHRERAFENGGMIFGGVFVRDLFRQFLTVYGGILFFAAVAFVLCTKGRRQLFRSQNFAWIPIVALVSMLLVQYVSLLKVSRYCYCLIPVFSLIVPHVVSALPRSVGGYFEQVILIYFSLILLVYPVRVNYGWTRLRQGLDRPAALFGLNPNETVQLIPCMADNQQYTILGKDYIDLQRGATTWVITKFNIMMDEKQAKSKRTLLWNKNIYLYEFQIKEDVKANP